MVKLGNAKKTAMAIPETWENKKLKDVAPLQRGFDLPYSQMKSGVYPVVFSNGIGAYHSEYMIPGPGVITGRSGTIGKVHFVEQHYWPHNTSLWVTDFHGNYEKYVYYLFNRINWNAFNSGSGVPTLNRNDVHEIEVALPPLTEQISIATALSDIDALIANLEKLIAKKKAIKQGAMQELLTGKRRLLGFTKEWGTVQIGSLTSVFSGGTPSTSNPLYWGGNIPWMSSGELNKKIVREVQGRITAAGMENSSTRMIPAFCVLIGLAGQGKTRGTAAYNTVPLCTNQSIGAIFPNDSLFDSKFLYFYMDTKYQELRDLSDGGGGRGGLTKKLIEEFWVTIPTEVSEQTAIAEILTDMDAEIEELEKELHKTRGVKQGMMSELLTGRIRLIDKEDA